MTMIQQRSLRFAMIPALGVLLLLGACTRADTSGSGAQPPLKESTMTSQTQTFAPRTAIPPIDAAAPAEVETATFGLG